MTYDQSYDTAKARRCHFILDELMKLSNTIPHNTFKFGRPVKFPVPTLFVLLGLKFDSGLSYRDFVALVNFNPFLLRRLSLEKAPSYSLLQKSLKRLDTGLVHNMYELLARERPPPQRVAVDSSGFSHATGGEWRSVRFKKTLKRRFTALHNAVDTDTLLIQAARVRARPGGDAKCMVPLLKRIRTERINTIYGDKGYISRKNAQYINDMGAYPAIEPKKNLRVYSKGHRAYGSLIREYRADPEEWKRRHDYGMRNLAETLFSMMKLRFTGSLSSRGYKERRRELLIKVVLHNIGRLNFLECDGR
ncbi:MAG: IS5 family transposase [Candidatus Thorarchaeota archaeon]|nr:IS5 family transposase [Candidatus Thorarchaeota archaeon]